MALFDLSNLSGLFSGQSPDGGWTSGTTVTQPGAFFSQTPGGGIAGLTQNGQNTLGRAMQTAATQMPGGFKMPGQSSTPGAFADGSGPASSPPTPPADPNAQAGSSDWGNLIANWKKHMMPTGGQ